MIMTYDENTKTLTADEGKVIVRKADGTVYGKVVSLGKCWYIGGVLQDPPHDDTPDDFEEHEDETGEVAEKPTTIKEKKIADIKAYDASDAVNSFSVNGESAWLTNAERTSYTASVSNAEILGEKSIDLLLNSKVLTLPTDKAKVMLAQISRYADKCWMVTQQHILDVEALTDDKSIEEYDYKSGYPKKLEFEL